MTTEALGYSPEQQRPSETAQVSSYRESYGLSRRLHANVLSGDQLPGHTSRMVHPEIIKAIGDGSVADREAYWNEKPGSGNWGEQMIGWMRGEDGKSGMQGWIRAQRETIGKGDENGHALEVMLKNVGFLHTKEDVMEGEGGDHLEAFVERMNVDLETAGKQKIDINTLSEDDLGALVFYSIFLDTSDPRVPAAQRTNILISSLVDASAYDLQEKHSEEDYVGTLMRRLDLVAPLFRTQGEEAQYAVASVIAATLHGALEQDAVEEADVTNPGEHETRVLKFIADHRSSEDTKYGESIDDPHEEEVRQDANMSSVAETEVPVPGETIPYSVKRVKISDGEPIDTTKTKDVGTVAITEGGVPYEYVITVGNILNAGTEAVVVPSNWQFNFGGGVGKGILKALGEDETGPFATEVKLVYRHESQGDASEQAQATPDEKPLPLGTAHVFNGPTLDALQQAHGVRDVIMVNIHPDRTPEGKAMKAEEAIREAVFRALIAADQAGIESIAFPQMGTGISSNAANADSRFSEFTQEQSWQATLEGYRQYLAMVGIPNRGIHGSVKKVSIVSYASPEDMTADNVRAVGDRFLLAMGGQVEVAAGARGEYGTETVVDKQQRVEQLMQMVETRTEGPLTPQEIAAVAALDKDLNPNVVTAFVRTPGTFARVSSLGVEGYTGHFLLAPDFYVDSEVAGNAVTKNPNFQSDYLGRLLNEFNHLNNSGLNSRVPLNAEAFDSFGANTRRFIILGDRTSTFGINSDTRRPLVLLSDAYFVPGVELGQQPVPALLRKAYPNIDFALSDGLFEALIARTPRDSEERRKLEALLSSSASTTSPEATEGAPSAPIVGGRERHGLD